MKLWNAGLLLIVAITLSGCIVSGRPVAYSYPYPYTYTYYEGYYYPYPYVYHVRYYPYPNHYVPRHEERHGSFRRGGHEGRGRHR